MIRMYRTALLLSCVAAFAAKCAAATAVSTDFQNDAFTGLPLAANSGQSLRINVGERATEASLLAAKNAKLERLQLGKIMAENKLQCVEGAGTGRSRLFIASPEPELLDEDKRLLDSMNQRSDGTWDSVVTPPFLKSRYSRGCDEVAKAMIALAGVPRYTQYNYGGRLECKVSALGHVLDCTNDESPPASVTDSAPCFMLTCSGSDDDDVTRLTGESMLTPSQAFRGLT